MHSDCRIILSVIIPFFNNADSVISSHLSLFNSLSCCHFLEVILVDDGTCHEDLLKPSYKYITKLAFHSDRIVLLRQKNQKQGSARNYALRYSRGNYIWFVDSDDTVFTGSLFYLQRILNEKQPDILFHSLSISYLQHTGLLEQTGLTRDSIQSQHIIDCISSKLPLAPWSFIISASLASTLLFPERVFFEDLPYFIDLIAFKPKNVIYTSLVLYRYNTSAPSTTRGARAISKSIKLAQYSLLMGLTAIIKIVTKANGLSIFFNTRIIAELFFRHTLYYTLCRLTGR
jgi:glycosyltransferase involved in cell wall biosynthesis